MQNTQDLLVGTLSIGIPSLSIRFGTWKVRRLNQSRSKVAPKARRKERLSRVKLKQAFLIDSEAELFMYLIQCI